VTNPSRKSRALGAVLLPLSVMPFVAIRGDVISEHRAYVRHLQAQRPLGTAPAPPLPGSSASPGLEAPVRPSVPLGRDVHLTLGSADVLLELNRDAVEQGRRVLVDRDRDGTADFVVSTPAGSPAVRVIPCRFGPNVDAKVGVRADGGLAVHLPAAAVGPAPRLRVKAHGPACAPGLLDHAIALALPGGGG
jgi:hypothetical protein